MNLSLSWNAPLAEADESAGTQDARSPLSDEAVLVRRLAAGDESALTTMYECHAAAVFGFLCGQTRDRQEAEEVLQDTMVAAWRAASGFAGRSRLRTWLLAIAGRQLRDRHRRRALVLDSDAACETIADPADGPESATLARAGAEELAKVLETLAPRQREVLNLAFQQELSYVEMSEVLNVPVGTVKSRLNAAKAALRASLDRRGGVAR